jgi:hypothetical protein
VLQGESPDDLDEAGQLALDDAGGVAQDDRGGSVSTSELVRP